MLNWRVFLFVAVTVFLFVQFDTAESSPFNDLQPTGRPVTAGQALKNILQRAIGDNSSDESKPSAGSSEEQFRPYHGVHRCCASILNPNWLLTSGQCTADLAPDAISIVCGIRMYRTVVEIALLPYYQPAASKPTANDLALLRVGRALIFTSNVQPIPLYDGVEVSTGTATLVRYGPMDERWSWWNSKLQLAEVSILSACECQYRLGPALAPYLEPRNICTDNGFVTTMPLTATGGPSSRCVGDSGAPVMFAASELQPYTLLAVTGWTVAPFGTGPSVHVRVAPHLDGILSIIGVN